MNMNLTGETTQHQTEVYHVCLVGYTVIIDAGLSWEDFWEKKSSVNPISDKTDRKPFTETTNTTNCFPQNSI